MTIFRGQIESVTINGHTFEASGELPADFDATDVSAAAAIAQCGSRFTVECEPVALSVRQRRWLLTGRPRPRRAETKELNRQRKLLRQLLVRDAGDTTREFRTWWGVGDSTERCLLDLANGRAVSVPRSLRRALGRYVGGGCWPLAVGALKGGSR